jgi:Kef-type K+ transport system membrane component KefB
MSTLATATAVGFLVLVASMLSVELGVSVAIIEITLGVLAGNFFGVTTTPWIDFLASFGGILLTFLAGAEVDPRLMREKLKESLLMGGLSFLLPFIGAGLFAYYVIALKIVGVFPVALRYVRPYAAYTTLLMSTGLTFGTISSLYGLTAGIIDPAQFSVLVTTVILSAVVPTYLAQRFFSPPVHALTLEEIVSIEDEEFEPLAGPRPRRG